MGLLYDLTAQEQYPAPASIFGNVGPATAPAPVPQDESAGSPLWWLLAAGAAALLIGAAVWLNRRLTRAASRL
jgi:hypothetical protein